MARPCAKCGKIHHRIGPRKAQSYCLACHAENMRRTRPRHRNLAPEAKMKANVRSYANVYKRRGKLTPEPCKECGKKAQMHHPDYSRPIAVEWLCRECHLN